MAPAEQHGQTDGRTNEWTDGARCHETGQLRSHVPCSRIYLLSRYTPKSESTDHHRRYSVLKEGVSLLYNHRMIL